MMSEASVWWGQVVSRVTQRSEREKGGLRPLIEAVNLVAVWKPWLGLASLPGGTLDKTLLLCLCGVVIICTCGVPEEFP